jgi:murein L,D-transpeptidase YcbB/YkuD
MDRWLFLAITSVLVFGTSGAAWPQTVPVAQTAPVAPASSAMSPESDAGGPTTSSGTESGSSEAPKEPSAAAPAAEAKAVIEPTTPVGVAVKARLEAIPDEGTDEEKKERAALVAFYGGRGYAPLWVEAKGFNADARGTVQTISSSWEWGLEPNDFVVPKLEAPSDAALDVPVEAQSAAEVDLTLAVLKYARYARGGRIMRPSEQLNSNLDRKPQLIEPATVLDGLAAAANKSMYLVGTHPQHIQFQRLKAKYVEALGPVAKGDSRKPNAAAKRIQANMEMWRWMWADLGDLYLMANVPAYMIDVVEAGKTIHTERIVVGEIGKQSSIFTRKLRDITFRPMWRVPESIKVKELWPSLLRGGGLMRQYGLEVETKDGRRLDWRTMDWRTLDIREYEVVQPPMRSSAMGVVKFSFPSQHTIFMHDTPDKWMFNSQQRTLSHGCLRLRNPLRVAELVLAHDKGWDAAKVSELAKSGPLHNEVLIEKRIPMHIAYFTAWVDDDGKLKTYSDIYGHEKRVAQALDGKWTQIAKGRDHLAPVVPDKAHLEDKPVKQAASGGKSANDDFLGSFFGGY